MWLVKFPPNYNNLYIWCFLPFPIVMKNINVTLVFFNNYLQLYSCFVIKDDAITPLHLFWLTSYNQIILWPYFIHTTSEVDIENKVNVNNVSPIKLACTGNN